MKSAFYLNLIFIFFISLSLSTCQQEHPKDYGKQIESLMQKIDTNIRNKQKNNTRSQDVSIGLIQEMAQLSKTFIPFDFKPNNKEMDYLVSPGRGALLLACLNRDFNQATLNEIYRIVNFSGAYLENADLSKKNLDGIILCNAYLRGANFNKASLVRSNLTDSDLTFANLTHTDLSKAILTRVNFSDADFNKSIMHNSYLAEANLSNAKLVDIRLKEANLNDIIIHEDDKALLSVVDN
jgi:uncharacterized protein YjbI with pentapeptide repeats